MRSRALTLIVAALATVMICNIAFAKRGQVRIRVIDVDEKGKQKRVSGASVQLWDTEGNMIGEPKETDSKGNVTISGLEGKTEYVIKVTAPNGKLGTGSFTTNKNGGAGLQVVKVPTPG